MRKLPARKLLGAIIATALFLPETAFTLGLGEIEVNSALNQKLNADIELLSIEADETENIIVKLASRKEFSRAGLDRPYLLNDLRFKSEVIDGVPHIKITSSSPIREPFLNFLVEVDWPNGHMLREYTVLLDPPVFMTETASAATKRTGGSSEDAGFRPSSGSSANVVPAPVTGSGFAVSYRPVAGDIEQPQAQPAVQQAANTAFVPAPVFQQQRSINQPPDSYRIQSGDTAWSLAQAMRPEQNISVEQMMVAMLRANPESFINENVNGLKRGYILRVPDYNQIISISPEDARALVREQAALWRQYQQAQSGGKPASAMSSAEMSANGAQNDGVLANGEDDAYLEIVSAGSGSSMMSGKDPAAMSAQELRAELALARERIETERVEKEALQQRVNSLEQNVGKMKGMLSIEDEQLSDVQKLGQSDEEAAAADIEAEVQGSTIDDLLDKAGAESSADMAADTAAEDASAGDTFAGDMSTDGGDAAVEEEAVFLDKTSAEDMSSDQNRAEESAAEPGQAEPSGDAAASEQPSVNPLDKLLSDPILLAAAGGGLLFIIAVIALIIKRRKVSTETDSFELKMSDDDLDSLADDVAAAEAIETESLVESQIKDRPEASDVAGEDDFNSDSNTNVDATEQDATITKDSSLSEAGDDEPRDDVMAEADVYLAYGIYQQAEELLTQAIADNPERDDYRVKLAETHYASKNEEAFVKVATEIKKRIGEDTPAWNKVMRMGQDLCADNPMFQGRMVSGLDVDSLSEKEPKMDFDLGIDDSASSEDMPDLNLSMDDEPLELPEMDLGEAEEADTATEPMEELEFNLSDTGAFVAAPAEEDEFALDIDASELDIDVSISEPQEKAETTVSVDDEIHEIDGVDGLDLDFGLDDEVPAGIDEDADDEEIALDLTEDAAVMDLDTAKAGAGSDTQSDEEDFDLSALDDVDEISTKLDLARAYLDMGDHEGTREILDEVLAEGNDEQKQEANELMAKLG